MAALPAVGPFLAIAKVHEITEQYMWTTSAEEQKQERNTLVYNVEDEHEVSFLS